MTGGLTFDAATHTYRKDGRPAWQSVTQVLKRAGLFDWMVAVPEPLLTRARLRGTAVHAAIHYWNENDFDLDDFRDRYPDIAGYVDAWVAFCAQQPFVPALCEYWIYSARYDLAGTIDCLGTLAGQAALVDFATGDPADVAKHLQTAAYLLVAREWATEDPALEAFFAAHPVVRRYAVQLRPDGTYRLNPYSDPADTRHFLALVEAQRIVDSYRRTQQEVA
jgi:hypothetical protein